MNASSEKPGRVFWFGVVVGGALMAFGARGLVLHASAVRPANFATWFVGGDLLHDAVIAPTACVLGAVVGRVVPDILRAPVRAGLFTSAIVVAVAWTPLHGYGRATVPDNATVDPLDYSTAVLTVVAVVWAIVAVWVAAGIARRSRASRL